MADSTLNIPEGFCQCGCGEKTKIAQQTVRKEGLTKGRPKRFLRGHNVRGKFGENSSRWNGGKIVNHFGYILRQCHGHKRADKRGYVFEHILIVEKVLGKSLPEGAEIHHYDNNRSNNIPSNLIICQDHAYHLLLHRRSRALKACGHASWRKCYFCQVYDAPENLTSNGYHKLCRNKYLALKRSLGL